MRARAAAVLSVAAVSLMLVACDLSIEKTASRNPGVVGKPLVYSLAVKNSPAESGSENVSNVVVTDTLPQSVRFVSATAGQGTCARPNASRQVICDLGTVGEDQTVVVRIAVVPLRVGAITNVASVKGDTTGPSSPPGPGIISEATPGDGAASETMDPGELEDYAESRMAEEGIAETEAIEFDPQENNTDSVTVRVVAPPSPNACTMVGTPGNDILRGTPGRDVICGLGGNDIIYGMGGNDRIVGGAGNDILHGMGGNDVIFGGPGNDILRGGPGQDTLIGGPGRNIVRQ